MNNKVILIYADTYDDSYGCEIEIFGIATDKEKKKEICQEVKKQGFRPKCITIPLDTYCRKYLGGFYE